MNNKIGTNFGPFIKRNSLFDVLKKTAQAGFEAADFSLTRTYGVERENEENFYKLVERFSNSKAYGPLTQGLNYPVNDLSRGSSIDEIIGVVAITAVQAQNTPK